MVPVTGQQMTFTCKCLQDLCKGKVSARTLANGYPQQCLGRECWDCVAPAVTPLLNHAFSTAISLCLNGFSTATAPLLPQPQSSESHFMILLHLVVTNDLHHHADLRNSLSFLASKVN